MIQQILTKTITKMILITKTYFPTFLHSSTTRARATKPRPCNFCSTGDQTDP